MKHEFCAEWDDVMIRPLHRYDIESLRKWRNKEDENKYLRNVGPISNEDQLRWFGNYLNQNGILFFVIDYKKTKTVGSFALYNVRGSECEIGKLVIGEQEARGHHVAQKAFLMAMGIADIYIGINKFLLSVHEDNIPAKIIYERLGFEKYGLHPFEKGGFEEEMQVTADRLRNSEGADMIIFYKENDVMTRNWGGCGRLSSVEGVTFKRDLLEVA